MSNLPDHALRNTNHLARPGVVFFALVLSACMWMSPTVQAQAAGAQRAIENLENCDSKKGDPPCVRILKVEGKGNGKQAIKAQIRGRRIIWYEYDRKSGRARRTN